MTMKEQQVIQKLAQNITKFQNAQPTIDGTLNIFPACRNGCQYHEVCEGEICSVTLQLNGREAEMPKPCRDIDEELDKMIMEYYSDR